MAGGSSAVTLYVMAFRNEATCSDYDYELTHYDP